MVDEYEVHGPVFHGAVFCGLLGGTDACGVADVPDGFLDDVVVALRFELVIQFVVFEQGHELVLQNLAIEVLHLAVSREMHRDIVGVLDDIAGESNLLGAFDDTDNGELEREMEQGPNLLANRTVVAMGKVVEVERPEKDLS